MMKIIALLMAIVAITIQPSQAAVACFKFWTRGEAGTAGTQTFSGITNGTSTEDYNNPLFYSLANAQAGFTKTSGVKGRLSAKLPTSNYVGKVTFDFFKGSDQIVVTFTKATGKAVIKSGKGCYAGITGTATRTQVGTTVPKVFEWKYCPKVAPSCKALRG
jgi:hypothetical protein